MAQYKHCNFLQATVYLDRDEFDGCMFSECVLVYGGRGPISFRNNSLVNCRWVLADAASNTIRFLVSLYAGGESGKILVESLFDMVRQGRADEFSNELPKNEPITAHTTQK